jgi:hypothetical protein
MMEDGGPDGAGQMPPTLTPVEAGPAEDTALAAKAKVDAGVIEERSASVRQLPAVLVEHYQRLRNQSIGNGDGDATGHMVVARPRVSQRLPAAPQTARRSEAILGQDHETFQHASDERRGQPEVSSAAVFFKGEESRLVELCKVSARRLRRHPGYISELGSGEGSPIYQRSKHIGTRRIAHEGGDLSDLGSCIHAFLLHRMAGRAKQKYFGRRRSDSA